MADFKDVVKKLTETNEKLDAMAKRDADAESPIGYVKQALPEILNDNRLQNKTDKAEAARDKDSSTQFDKAQIVRGDTAAELKEVDIDINRQSDLLQKFEDNKIKMEELQGQKLNLLAEGDVKGLKKIDEELDYLRLTNQLGQEEINSNSKKEKAQLEFQQTMEMGFKQLKEGQLSPSAQEEKDKEEAAARNKQGTVLQKIAGGIGGLLKSGKDAAKSAGKGLMFLLKGTLFAGLVFAFARFLQNPAFARMVKFIDKTIKKLDTFYDAFFGPKGSFGKGISTLFSDDSGLGKIAVGVIGLTALFAGAKLVKFLAPLSKGIVKLLTGIGGIGNKLPDAIMGKDVGKSPKDGKPSKLGKSPKDGKPSKLGKLAKVGVKAAKFIPGFGLAVTAISGIFDGVNAGLKEAKKENSTKLSVFRESSAGILSGLTFGLVDQKTISDQFKKVGQSFSTAGDTISKDFSAMKDSVVGGFNKYLGPEAQWAKDFETSLQNFKLPTLEEIGTSVKNLGADMTKQFESLTGLEVPSFDEIGIKLNGFADDVKGKFTELTGIKVPSFDEVQGKLTNLGTDLSAKFEGLTGIDISESTKAVADKLKGLASGFSLDGILGGIGQSVQLMPFDFTFGETIKKTLLKIFDPDLASNVMGGEEMAMGGRVKAGMLYTINERGVETFVPDQPGQMISAERTNMMMKSGGGKTSSQPIFVNAPQTQNAAVSNNSTTVTSTSIVEPDPMFRRNTQFAI